VTPAGPSRPACPMRPADSVIPGRPAVLIMTKAPRPGTVKTRLHPLLGPDGCAGLAELLIRHTVTVATEAARMSAGMATVFAAADPPDALTDVGGLVPGSVRLLRQRGASLGERLAAATGEVFARGHRPVVVIGTDVPTLTAGRLAQAFGELARGRDVVFGPARDGGYYLVGLSRPAPELFALDPGVWGSDRVLAVSLAAARRAGLDAGLLPTLRDLDTPGDAEALQADPVLPAAIADALQRRPAHPAAPGQQGPSWPLPVSIVVPALNEAPVITAGLYWPWFLDGRLAELRSWAAAARQLTTDERTRARLDRVLASTSVALGDIAQASKAATSQLTAGRELGDDELIALAHNLLGMVAWARGDPRALGHHTAALRHTRRQPRRPHRPARRR
jgi:uncharacterized protein